MMTSRHTARHSGSRCIPSPTTRGRGDRCNVIWAAWCESDQFWVNWPRYLSPSVKNRGGGGIIAVSSSPMPWMDIFALPEKWQWLRAIPTPRSENVHNFLMTVRPLNWACGHGTELLLILKKLFLTWLLPDIFRYDSLEKCPTILYAVNLWLKPVSLTGARGINVHPNTANTRHPLQWWSNPGPALKTEFDRA